MSFRRDYITKPIFKWAKTALPALSETEAEAISSGDVHFEAELFSGKPDWTMLRKMKAPTLTAEEQAFVDGPCRAFCDMLDNWQIDRVDGDLPKEAWDYLRENGFFGMIIPKEYGGKGFSAYAHSEVVRYISSRSVAGAVTVMVPNSLGPAN
ncbi:acyl-CoA dehydrogenase family protein [Pseudosulfitobacter pseudonitzschiae]|uniref:acyl-CoA dehydrogenase family protein n=1 Tax=Pseudosulfitobacter pseudonitzschiae TaxID=1402135 RepID=UPI001CD5A15D|nr:acyl-CoA dehydrogenase family protein [Pseudosulfitobacter pseudonitzschiae]